VLAEVIRRQHMVLLEAGSIAEARAHLAQMPADLVLIEADLPDGSGLALAADIKRRRPITQTIVITSQPSIERAIEAIRLGAGDFLIKPLEAPVVTARMRKAVRRHHRERSRLRRMRRLRRACHKLNVAHEEVSQQVDVLCTDLVTAYQELATQIHQVSQTGPFTELLRNELDLEQVLRKTIEHVLNEAGPTNAAIFLPSSGDEHTLGGYVNYDKSDIAADLLLQHLADAVAPVVARSTQAVSIRDDQTLEVWFGDENDYLLENHVLAVACRHNDESLAVLVLYRHHAEPYAEHLVKHLDAIGPLLGQYLAKVIHVHHRHLPGLHLEDEDDLLAGA
jgi:DNA-binding response OmpR family regulator